MSLFRIGANIQAMDSLRSLYHLNEEMATRQSRLSSGKRINTARDDTAGYAIARSLEARGHGLSAALSNVQNAQSLLAIAEGGYQNQMDILQTIKEKSVQEVELLVPDIGGIPRGKILPVKSFLKGLKGNSHRLAQSVFIQTISGEYASDVEELGYAALPKSIFNPSKSLIHLLFSHNFTRRSVIPDVRLSN